MTVTLSNFALQSNELLLFLNLNLRLVLNRHPPYQFLSKGFPYIINFKYDFNIFLSIQQLRILILGFHDFCILISIFSIIFRFIVSSYVEGPLEIIFIAEGCPSLDML